MTSVVECRQVSEAQRGLFVTSRQPAGALLISEEPLAYFPCSEKSSDSCLDIAFAARLFALAETKPDVKSALASLHTNIEISMQEGRRAAASDVAAVLDLAYREIKPSNKVTAQLQALNFLQRVRVNALTISDDEGRQAGLGMFTTCAMINHTCGEPSAFVWFRKCGDDKSDGVVAEVRATRDLDEGDELAIAYIDRSILGFQNRRTLLRENLGFDCTCVCCDKRFVSKRCPSFETCARRLVAKRRALNPPPPPPPPPAAAAAAALLTTQLREPTRLCDLGVAEYCRGDAKLALSTMEKAHACLNDVVAVPSVPSSCLGVASERKSYGSNARFEDGTCPRQDLVRYACDDDEAVEKYIESHEEHGTCMDSAAAAYLSLQRRVSRFLANAAVAQHEWSTAECALEELLSSSATLFPCHDRKRWERRNPECANAEILASGPVSRGDVQRKVDAVDWEIKTPHLDTALAEADLARVRLQRLRLERNLKSKSGDEEGGSHDSGLSNIASNSQEAAAARQLLARARHSVGLLCGPDSEIARLLGSDFPFEDSFALDTKEERS